MESAPDYRERRSRAAVRLPVSLAVLALAASPAAALAQVPPIAQQQPLPPTREQVTRPELQEQRNRASRLEVEGGLERAPCALDSPEFRNIRFVVRGADFDGLQEVPPEDLAPSYSAVVGTEQPISVVCDIRDRAAAILHNAGYIAAIEVPEQRMTDGVVHFHVVMARLTEVRVRGNATGAERIIGAYLTKLTKQPVFNRYVAERALLLASDLPGYTVRLTLRSAGKGPGEVLGDVTVQRRPAYADVSVDNGGSHQLGPWGGLVRGELYGLTGFADRTVLSAFATADLEEQQTVQIGHDMAVGADGLRIGGLVTAAWAHPSFDAVDLRSDTFLATLQGDYPLVRRLGRTIDAILGVDIINQNVRLDSTAFTRDKTRVAFLRLLADLESTDFGNGRSAAEPLWRFTSDVSLRKGLDVLGATDSCPTSDPCGHIATSRSGGISTATVVRALLHGEYRPAPNLTLALTARGQYAADRLLSFELFSAGNYTVGRGYDPGVLLGDRGWGTQAEVAFGSLVPQSARKPAIQAYAFFDHAQVDSVGAPLLPGASQVSSAGVGARVNYDRFRLDSSIAFPLSRVGDPPVKPGPRLLVTLTTRLFPWSFQ